jgi:thiol-disulfide isomerase/thioredoxin
MAALVRALGFVVVASAAYACDSRPDPQEHTRESEPTAALTAVASKAKPRFEPGTLPVAAFVAQRITARPAKGLTVVYVGATWCEPCRRFHRAVAAGELDAELANVEFIDYDFDVAGEGLIADGYRAKFIPLFALPKSDGSASGRQIEGGIKGDGAVAEILPRLQKLIARR